MSDVDAAHLRLLEAILFASAEALTGRELAERLPDEADVEELLRELQARSGERRLVPPARAAVALQRGAAHAARHERVRARAGLPDRDVRAHPHRRPLRAGQHDGAAVELGGRAACLRWAGQQLQQDCSARSGGPDLACADVDCAAQGRDGA